MCINNLLDFLQCVPSSRCRHVWCMPLLPDAQPQTLIEQHQRQPSTYHSTSVANGDRCKLLRWVVKHVSDTAAQSGAHHVWSMIPVVNCYHLQLGPVAVVVLMHLIILNHTFFTWNRMFFMHRASLDPWVFACLIYNWILYMIMPGQPVFTITTTF